jgi:hypothetical protein
MRQGVDTPRVTICRNSSSVRSPSLSPRIAAAQAGEGSDGYDSRKIAEDLGVSGMVPNTRQAQKSEELNDRPILA